MKRSFNSFCALALAGCAANATPPVMSQLTWSDDTLTAATELVRRLDDSTFTDEPLKRPLAIRSTMRGTFVVSDVGDEQIIVMDARAKTVRRIGSRGRGPGELLGLSRLAIHGDRVFAAEAYNGRISEFTLNGTYVGAYSAPFASGALAIGGSSLLTASRSVHFYASLLTGSEAGSVFRRLASDDATRRWNRMLGHDLIAADSDRVWVFDQASGALCEFRSANRVSRCSRLPTTLLNRLNAYRDDRVNSLEKAIHMRVEAAPLAKDMVFANHRLALLLPLPELAVVVVNVDDGSLTPVITYNRDVPEWIRSARSFDWDSGGFVFVGDDGIARFTLANNTLHSRTQK